MSREHALYLSHGAPALPCYSSAKAVKEVLEKAAQKVTDSRAVVEILPQIIQLSADSMLNPNPHRVVGPCPDSALKLCNGTPAGKGY